MYEYKKEENENEKNVTIKVSCLLKLLNTRDSIL